MESESEKKEFHFPGVSWLKARLSRKMLFITAVFIIVCLLLTSFLFLRYLRSFVSNQYDQAIDETNRLADEVCSFLIGSDGKQRRLRTFLRHGSCSAPYTKRTADCSLTAAAICRTACIPRSVPRIRSSFRTDGCCMLRCRAPHGRATHSRA